MTRTLPLIAILIGMAGACVADQTQIRNYDEARTKKFYRLYAKVRVFEATDIYCGLRFSVDPKVLDFGENENVPRPAPWLTLEHAYPAQWMADALNCGNRETCGSFSDEAIKKRFNHAEADMHNLWPAVETLNISRRDRPFGEIPGNARRTVNVGNNTFECEYKRQSGFVEPRRIAKGNLARSILYMCKEYGFPVEPGMLATLKKWNKQDLPTQGERKRNDKIEKMQGTRNTYIDNPDLADDLVCVTP